MSMIRNRFHVLGGFRPAGPTELIGTAARKAVAIDLADRWLRPDAYVVVTVYDTMRSGQNRIVYQRALPPHQTRR